jgi:[acyl-carrier-protein] S-malonyltransferase
MVTWAVFPGQGSQYVGMARELHQADARVRELYQVASDALGEDLAAISFDGPQEKLKQTRFTQPAILVHSLSLLTLIGERLPAAQFTAGHSLGEYSALAASGVLSFEDAIRAVVVRATAMEAACQSQPGTMATALGLSREQIMTAIEMGSNSGIVVAANINSDAQIVASGSVDGVQGFMAAAKELGAKRVIQLEVGGAFHSPLMASATETLAQFLTTIEFSEPRFPVIPNVTAVPDRNPASLRSLLAQQITSSVRWSDTMKAMMTANVTRVIEIGPGKVLTTLAKREMPGVTTINIDTLADIDQLLATEVGA